MRSPRCMATMIGSLPLTDPAEAVQLVLETLEEAPIWPELPRRSFWEGMVAAHTESFPGLMADENLGKLSVDTTAGSADALAAFYERVFSAEESGQLDQFAVSPRHASALELFAQSLERQAVTFPCVKVHCIGPVSMGLQLADEQGKPLYYHETFSDVILRQVTLQSRWMVRRFRPFSETLIAFLDEPSLAAFGSSSLIGVSREEVIRRLSQVISALQKEGAFVGVHVCGNTDWKMVLEAGADIINYDAYGYGETIWVYAKELRAHMERGGVLAWGIVPTSQELRHENPRTLQDRFLALVEGLSKFGIDRDLILAQSMITPACGMGSLSVQNATRTVELLRAFSRSMQQQVRK